MDVVIAHKAEILALLFALSEVIGLLPNVKSSGVFQFIYNALKSAVGK